MEATAPTTRRTVARCGADYGGGGGKGFLGQGGRHRCRFRNGLDLLLGFRQGESLDDRAVGELCNPIYQAILQALKKYLP